MASVLTDTVKQRTEEIKTSLKETDWRAELGGLQKDLKEETEEVAQHAREASEQLGHKARYAVESLPGAVQNLPTSISVGNLPEAGAKLTREASAKVGKTGKQLGAMSQRFVNKTTDLFDNIVNSIQEANDINRLKSSKSKSLSLLKGINTINNSSQRYSRLEADIAAMQRDSSTYCDQPEDAEQFQQWIQDFNLKEKKKEIGSIIGTNAFMAELQSRIVPLIVSYEDFWTRYFYRLHKLHAKHEAIQALTFKASEAGLPSGGGRKEEAELGWGTDEEEEEEDEEQGEEVAREEEVAVKQDEDQEDSEEEDKVTTAAVDGSAEDQTKADGVDNESVEEPSQVEPKEEEVEEDVEEEAEEASTALEEEVIVEETENTGEVKKKEEKYEEEEKQPEEAVEKVSSDLSSDFELDDEPVPTGGDGVVTERGFDEDDDWNSDWE
jgi:hypothetical protein